MPATYVITGTGKGIGLELTRQLLKSEQIVQALARNPEKSEKLLALLREFPEHLKVSSVDVTSDQQVATFVKSLGSKVVDILINNAGIAVDDENFENLSLEDVMRVFMTNSLGPMRMTRALLPLLKKSAHPKVIHISSLMGSIGDNTSGGSYAYRMSKAALNMFHKSFSIDFPMITSLVIHPGWVKTDMGGPTAPDLPETSVRGILAVIGKATGKDTGQFLDFEGDLLPW